MAKYGKVFRCKKGKHKGKLVRYKYSGGRFNKSKKMTLYSRRS